jgi:hypothetical protein
VNILGTFLLEGAVRATAFALLGTLVYLIMRRWSPAAGSLTAASTLVLMSVVSLLAFCPWPRWGPGFPMEGLRASVVSAGLHRDRAGDANGVIANRQEPEDRASATPAVAVGRLEPPSDEKTTMAYALLETLVREWDRPVPVPNPSRWTWRSWVAIVFVTGVAMGLVRLLTGLWAMRRLRSRSQPVADPILLDTMEILRAEMSCVRPVEIRTSADLATPATIGWKRALILLPDDWHTWDDTERRAVLAHELAHVCRGDFLTGLLSQLSLALQFYHPLAHWLSARLRLEQELAADAWTARLSGGNLPYLATLAQLALRRDDRAPGWPARAFLPSRGTFVRRIEMLRNSKRVRHVLHSSTTRFFTVGFLASLGLMVAGLRGPIGPSLVQAQTTTESKAPSAALRSAKGAFDLSLVPAESRMILAVQPAALLGRPEMRPVLKEDPMLGKAFPFPPDEVDQLVVFWEGTPANPTDLGRTPMIPPPSGVIIRMANPQKWEKVIGTIIPSPEETRHSGQSYFRPRGGGGQPPYCAYAPDDRTLVLAGEDSLRTVIEDRKGPRAGHGWDEAWNQITKGQVNAALETRWLRRRLNQGRVLDRQGAGPRPAGELAYETISPLLEKTQAYALGIDVDKELKADLVATVGSPDDLKEVTETLQALLTLGRNAVPSLQRNLRNQPGAAGEASEWALGLFAIVVEKARLETAGQTVHLRSGAPFEMAEASRILMSFVQNARVASRRFDSVENLKQIGLAFHNYAASNNHLPPPVLHGGKSGKVPYSWRVALLPYLECQELYNQYNFDEPWDGPNNRKLIDHMPKVYGYPAVDGTSKTHTSYFVFTGPETLLGKGEEPSFANITDGTSNTLLAVEANRQVPWTKPEDIPFDPQGALPELGGFTPDGVNALFGDGSVRYIKKSINPIVLKALITRAGGEVISSDSF